jgi:hypothetical protein
MILNAFNTEHAFSTKHTSHIFRAERLSNSESISDTACFSAQAPRRPMSSAISRMTFVYSERLSATYMYFNDATPQRKSAGASAGERLPRYAAHCVLHAAPRQLVVLAVGAAAISWRCTSSHMPDRTPILRGSEGRGGARTMGQGAGSSRRILRTTLPRPRRGCGTPL